VGGFVDGQTHWSNKSELSEGFVVNDGALYLSKEGTSSFFKVDIPFRSNSSNSSASTAGANFAIATTKAQAYVGYIAPTTCRFKLGQFDTPFGAELNDTVDNTFSRQGIVTNSLLPVVHTGLMATHVFMDNLTVSLMVANQKDQGAKRSLDIDYGFQAGWAQNGMRFSGGLLQTRSSGKNLPLVELMAGMSMDKFSVDVELDAKKPAATTSTMGWGLMGIGSYQMMPELALSLRAEHVKKIVADTTTGSFNTKQTQFTAGPQYSVSSQLKLKADYSYLVHTPDASAAKVKTSTFILGAVYKI
jgi:hypothetical protein